ncbi:hypothetical protein HU200_005067 [Digitaria exilis]|uniref:F-box domain-containing protein n=1 Tax=Digitaria exilis TaxID=1010633 RepID=A0A835FRK2_9POAL|nr:hypothetical protein HU200_005067 [Digitaria exilis]CAB3502494.1 unnamed protein product [Digitaria exilis]
MSSSSFLSSGRDGGLTASPPPPATDWAALPSDIVLDVFLRLGPHEVMLGAERLCKPWRRVALEEPTLWRRVGFDRVDYYDERWMRCHYSVEEKMLLAAVDRAKGQCEAFKGDCEDDYLRRLVRSAPFLKSLSIKHYSYYQSGERRLVVEALKKLSFLEDLEINFTYSIVWDKSMLQSICKACPRLKKLLVMYASAYDLECDEDEFDKEPVDGPIPVMRNLHTLKLYDCDLTCKGLNAILDGCPRLEILLIDGYFDDKRYMNTKLKMKCARVKNLTLDTRKKPYYCSYSSEEYY